MRLQLLLALVLALIAVDVQAADVRIDGNWWRQRNAGERDSYVAGFVDGLVAENLALVLARANSLSGPIPDEEMKVYGNELAHLRGITVGQLTDGLAQFYGDYRNRLILVGHAIPLVVDQIRGVEIEDRLPSFRQRAAEP